MRSLRGVVWLLPPRARADGRISSPVPHIVTYGRIPFRTMNQEFPGLRFAAPLAIPPCLKVLISDRK
jgi:hypothetical protein